MELSIKGDSNLKTFRQAMRRPTTIVPDMGRTKVIEECGEFHGNLVCRHQGDHVLIHLLGGSRMLLDDLPWSIEFGYYVWMARIDLECIPSLCIDNAVPHPLKDAILCTWRDYTLLARWEWNRRSNRGEKRWGVKYRIEKRWGVKYYVRTPHGEISARGIPLWTMYQLMTPPWHRIPDEALEV